jgi:hypothetical protein
VRREEARWRDDTKLDVQELLPVPKPQGKLDIWVPKISGKHGPLVLQLT